MTAFFMTSQQASSDVCATHTLRGGFANATVSDREDRIATGGAASVKETELNAFYMLFRGL